MSEILTDDSIKEIEYGWFDKNKFLTITIAMLLVWFGLLTFWYLKADEITKDPCTICSESKGKQVVCSLGSFIPVKRVYYPNGSILEDEPEVLEGEFDIPEYNFSKVNASFTNQNN